MRTKNAIHEARRQAIYEEVCRAGSVKVSDLSESLTVSDMTIRRDLLELERRGLAKRVHGGAVASVDTQERSFLSKEVENRERKRAIAILASRFLDQDKSVFLDAGTTCYELAKVLPSGVKTTVVTNGLATAMELRGKPEVKTIVIGGKLEEDENTLGGFIALESAAKLSVDICFFSASGFTREAAFNPGMIGTDVKRQMLRNSQRGILLVDSSKYGRRGLVELCRWDQVEALVTDSGLHQDEREFFRSKGLRIEIAEMEEAEQ